MWFRSLWRLVGLMLTTSAGMTFAVEPERVPQAILDLALEPPEIVTAPGPEYADDVRDYAMVIGLDRTPRGRLWAAWVAGGDNDKGYFVAATSDDDGATWSRPRLVIDPPDVPPGPGLPEGLRRRVLVGNFWTDPTGKLWLFFDQSLGYYDGRGGSWAITCSNPDDENPLWSAPRRIWHGMSLNKPLVLKNGEWLMPISLWQRHHIRPASLKEEFHELDAERMAHLFVSTDQGATWTRRGGVFIPQTNFDEHMFVERRDGSLWMLARTNYGIAETTSTDGGRTWSEPQRSPIENVSARFFLRRLASGRLLLVKNGPLGERLKSRSHLTAFLSDDEGKTWQGGLVIDERDGVSYPDGFQAPDGVIHIVHDRNRAADREILLAKFTEADVLAGRFVTPGSQGKILVNQARGGLDEVKKPTSSVSRPNVLFIAVDDLNDWVGTMGGHRQAHTPHLDRLAARGTFFERAYCAAPSCQPSRAAVLTGLRPSTTGDYVNEQKLRKLLPDVVTLPQHFTKHGYRTAGGGKIFHHADLDPQSWQEEFRQPRDPEPAEPHVSGVGAKFTWQPLDVADSAMGDHQVVSWADEQLQRVDPRPFFLAVGCYRPHMPLHVPRAYFDRHPLEAVQLPSVFDNDLDDVPPVGRWFATHRRMHEHIASSGQWPRAVQAYLASIAFFDAQLGRLVEALDRSPAAANTIVVLWSDHGWHLGEKEHWSKFALWEKTTHVPLLIVAPGVTRPETRCGEAVSLLDLYPTLCDLCGVPRPSELEGTSLLPQLRDPHAPRTEPAVMTFGPNNHAVRDKRWRYIRYSDGGEELYDHQADPSEWKNVVARADLTEVKRQLAAYLPKVNQPLTTPTAWLPPAGEFTTTNAAEQPR